MKSQYAAADVPAPVRIRRVLAAVLVLTLAAAFPASSPTEAAEPDAGGFRIVGKLPIPFEAEIATSDFDEIDRVGTGHLIVNTRLRRGYLVLTGQPQSMYTVLQSFDLDTLEFRRRVVFPGLVLLGSFDSDGSADVMHAVDEEGARLFLPFSDQHMPGFGNGAADGQRPFRRLEAIDERALDRGDATFSSSMGIPPQQAALLEAHDLRGMQFHRNAGTGRLLLLWGGPRPQGDGLPHTFHNHQLVQWGVDRAADTWESPTLLAEPCGGGPLTPTRGLDDSHHSAAILRGAAHLVLACGGTERTTTVLIADIDAAGKPTGSVRVRRLPREFADTFADQQAERFLVKTIGSGTTWWTYDIALDAWVGAMGSALHTTGSSAEAFGLDPTTGRLYAMVPDHIYKVDERILPAAGGLRYADTRLDPMPQMTVALPELTFPTAKRVTVDPAAPGRPRRLFVRRGAYSGGCFVGTANGPCDPPSDPYYLVIEDRVPVTTAAERGDPDRNTVDVAEAADTTGASFHRAAAGYGVRLRMVAGLTGATTPQVRGTFEPGSPTGWSLGSGCLATDREVVLGQVDSGIASDVTAAAGARGLAIDDSTRADLSDPAGRCWGVPFFAKSAGGLYPSDAPVGGHGFTAEPAESSCSGVARGPAPEARSAVMWSRSSTVCNQAAGTFEARATGSLALGDVEVARGEATAQVVPDDRGRMTTEVVAVAEGVRIGTVSIGRVVTRARAAAAGRPGTAEATFTREICGVHILGGFTNTGCLTPPQQEQFVAALNRALGSRGRARLRAPDAEYLRGTPGGYQAVVQRRRIESIEDTLVVRDESKAVPGLEIEFYSDDTDDGPGRRILQLAAVEASSQYGIYCLNGMNAAAKRCNGPAGAGSDSTLPAGLAALVEGMGDDTPGEVSLLAPSSSSASPAKATPLLQRVLRRLADLPASALRILVSNPRELLLLAGVWALVWMPCALAERRRFADRLLAARGT